LFLTLAQFLGALIGFRFPWQAAALFHASLSALAANFLYRKPELGREKILATLRTSALLTSAAAVLMMIQAAKWEPSSMLSAGSCSRVSGYPLWVYRSEWSQCVSGCIGFGVVIAAGPRL
jgi:hypothetical protein